MIPESLARRALLVTIFSNLSAAALAQDLVVESKESIVDQSLLVSVPFDGILIGDYDAKTNPGGTQTRPGLFGGSGNLPVDYSAVFAIDSPASQSQPSGLITIDAVDIADGILGIDGFEFDVLSGGSVPVGVDLAIVLQTFRTYSPFSIYPGGFEIPIPLPSGTILSLVIRSESPANVLVSPVGDTYEFDAVLPGIIAVEIDFGAGTQVFEIPFAVPFTGTLEIGASETVLMLSSEVEVGGDQQVEFPPFEEIPLELPTFPPGDETAGVLLGGTITSVAASVDLSVQIVAFGQTSQNPADFNDDGLVNGADLGFLISAWGVCIGCPEDLNFDGIVNGSDLGLFVSAWTG
jgi:hypothetical protein